MPVHIHLHILKKVVEWTGYNFKGKSVDMRVWICQERRLGPYRNKDGKSCSRRRLKHQSWRRRLRHSLVGASSGIIVLRGLVP
eukprot:862241-Amphidinium_carterae.2